MHLSKKHENSDMKRATPKHIAAPQTESPIESFMAITTMIQDLKNIFNLILKQDPLEHVFMLRQNNFYHSAAEAMNENTE